MKFEYTLAELSTAITALEQVYGKVSVLDPYLGTVLDPATLQPTAPACWLSTAACPTICNPLPGPRIPLTACWPRCRRSCAAIT